jgi:hypothetical protein
MFLFSLDSSVFSYRDGLGNQPIKFIAILGECITFKGCFGEH